jgi:lipoate-protein ligase A
VNPALRILDTGVQSARWNIAMTAALAQLHDSGVTPDTVRFHRYPRAVLLGRNQPTADVDIVYCARHGIEVARRVTGGGAVYMCPEILAWDVVVPRRVFGSLDDASFSVCGAAAGALSALGFDAKFVVPNAVVIGERKVSGSSGSFEGGTLVLQGTVVIDVDSDELAAALKIARGANWVASLAQASHAPAIDDVISAMTRSFSQALAREVSPGCATAAETALAQSLLDDEIGRDEFVFGATALRRSA